MIPGLIIGGIWNDCVDLCVLLYEVVLNSLHSIESKHEVTILSGLNEFVVKFFGPQGSKYFFSFLPDFIIVLLLFRLDTFADSILVELINVSQKVASRHFVCF